MVRTPVVIVASGPKGVLDVPATAEWLETHSVPVYGYQTEELPAFYSRRSGISIPRFDKVDDLAELIRMAFSAMAVRSAILVAVPVPEADEVDVGDEIEAAAKEASEQGISGKELTPWLLRQSRGAYGRQVAERQCRASEEQRPGGRRSLPLRCSKTHSGGWGSWSEHVLRYGRQTRPTQHLRCTRLAENSNRR